MYRNLDDLGRIVIPVEYRKSLRLKPGQAVSLEPRGNTLVLKRAVPTTAADVVAQARLDLTDLMRNGDAEASEGAAESLQLLLKAGL